MYKIFWYILIKYMLINAIISDNKDLECNNSSILNCFYKELISENYLFLKSFMET